ncbi:MAG: bifunctional DNA primase/polymerase [Acidobacteriia bacterium]|nr:bifunctional DNA primase/polymerase [Terriglobia bacterium]
MDQAAAIREAEAVKGAARGWAFTPVNGKVPTLPGWPDLPKPDAEQIRQWARAGNIGLRCGSVSGVVVVDEDRHKGGRLDSVPRTPTVETGGGGKQYYFAAPPEPIGNTAGRLAPHVDTRGDRGQVVFVGSVHPETGRIYRWADGLSPDDVQLAPFPADWLTKLRGGNGNGHQTPAKASVAVAVPDAYGRSALEAECRAVREAPAGTRNDTLNRAAFNLGTLVGGGILERVTVEDALLDAACASGLVSDDGERSVRGTIASGLKSGIAEPRRPEPTRQGTPAPAAVEVDTDARDSSTPPEWVDAPERDGATRQAPPAEPTSRRVAEAAIWRSADVYELLIAEPAPVPFLADRFLARQELALLTAPPKETKTWVTLAAAVDLALGRPVLGLFAVERPLRVLLADEEMGLRKIQRRLQRITLGLGLTDNDLRAVAERINLRPQQGMGLTSDEGIEALRVALEAFRPDVAIFDSFAAFTSGITSENDNAARRRFYNAAIAPFKQSYDLAVMMTAHPPLPSQNAAPDAKTRPRGGGDILAVADRAFYLEKVSETKTEHGRIVTATLGERFSREGGGLDGLCTVTVEDVGPNATTVRATSSESGSLAAAVGKRAACEQEILHTLRLQPEGRIYQPTLTEHCKGKGYDRTRVYYPALNGLEGLRRLRVLPAVPGSGKSGKWVQLSEEDDRDD